MQTKTVAKINDVSIVLIDGAEKQVPIKPICEALGIDHKRQVDKIKSDEILGSVGGLKPSVGADGKQYDMFCIPYMYIFGWLFTINPKNVKAEAKENVVRYKQECYTSLFNHFTDQSEFLEKKQLALEKQMEEVERIRNDFGNTKKLLDEARKALNKVKEMTFEEWQMNKRQLSIDFPN
ncbi:MAG: phage antirepressor N-terminal domain-containing protein [Carboxylicivirga sp.]|jgi:hypothetical protein|nr:phage antirepressor N-terminal domain-containing protein [Carboxylicivirga sp.]